MALQLAMLKQEAWKLQAMHDLQSMSGQLDALLEMPAGESGATQHASAHSTTCQRPAHSTHFRTTPTPSPYLPSVAPVTTSPACPTLPYPVPTFCPASCSPFSALPPSPLRLSGSAAVCMSAPPPPPPPRRSLLPLAHLPQCATLRLQLHFTVGFAASLRTNRGSSRARATTN